MRKGLLAGGCAAAILFLIVGIVLPSFAESVVKSQSVARKSIELLKDKKHEHDATVTLVSLGETAVPFLANAAKDPKEKVSQRILVLEILGDIKSPSATAALLEALKDPNFKVRRASARALGDIGDKASVEGLKQALGDFDPQVRYYAARSLVITRDPSLGDIFIKLLDDTDIRIKVSAVEGLGQIKETRAVEKLSTLTGDHNDEVRLNLAIALGKIGTRDTMPALNRLPEG